MKSSFVCLIAAVTVSVLVVAPVHAAHEAPTGTSFTFSETVEGSKGATPDVGINLLMPKSPTTPPNLSTYVHLYNNIPNVVSFGIDINEAASGTEKAESQGVAVEYAWLELVDGSGTRFFGNAPPGITTVANSRFFTETQAILARKGTGASSRETFYTLIGRSGSAQITGSDIAKVFDSTLKISLGDGTIPASGVTKARLHIRLLDTAVNLGDPEAFYDFSAGFEDIALLNQTDTQVIDINPVKLEPRLDAPVVELSPEGIAELPELGLSWVQRPAANQYNVVAYEDLFPTRGDYDFNDAVIAYSYALGVNASGEVQEIRGTALLIARGSKYSHDWSLMIPVPGLSPNGVDSSDCAVQRSADQQSPGLVANSGCVISVYGSTSAARGIAWKAFVDTVELFPYTDLAGTSKDVPLNTPSNPAVNILLGPKATMTIQLQSPLPTLSEFGTDDPRLYVRNTNQTILLTTVDSQNFPFAMIMPKQWKWPIELTKIGDAYPSFLDYVSSGGVNAVDWYNFPLTSKVVQDNYKVPGTTWEW